MNKVETPKRWQLVPKKDGNESLVNKINDLLSREEYETAFPHLCELARIKTRNPHVNVATGLVALNLDRKREAEEYFLKALDADPDDIDATYNCGLLAMTDGRIDAALTYFEKLVELQPNNAAAFNDLAVIWMNKNDSAKVRDNFTKALELNPNYTQARRNAMEFALNNDLLEWGLELLDFNNRQPGLTAETVKDVHLWIKTISNRSQQAEWKATASTATPSSLSLSGGQDRIRGRKIALFASYKSFVTDITQKLKEDGNEVREFSIGSTEEILKLTEWADIAWFEWCDKLLIEATKQVKKCPIICRLHSYEAFTEMPASVDWSKVDHLIFVNRSVQELLQPLETDSVPWTVIHNGVNVHKFSTPKDKKYGKRIVSVGHINYKKNPSLLLYCFKKIHEYDPEYSLHIAGAHQDPRIKLYWDHFLKETSLPVTFHGWVKDMPAWYADKDYVISTSLFESFHYSIAEGMACGLLPLIHNWYGAKYIYPDEYLFNDPDGCLELLQRLEKCNKEEEAEKNRRYISCRYELDGKFNQISNLLNRVVSTATAKTMQP